MMARPIAMLAIVSAALTTSALAIAAVPVDLFNGGDTHESVGQVDTKDLQRGVTYRASAFPLALRLRPPDGRWGGVQVESGRFRFVQLGHQRTGTVPRHGVGVITIESAKGATPSVDRTVEQLHGTPKLEAGPITTARVAGFAGKTFDATITGIDPGHYDPAAQKGISLVPFTTNHHCGYCTGTMHGETQDAKYAAKDQLFRIIVIDVRGKTVVIYLESTYHDQPKFLPQQTFPTFLPYARQMLASLRFPAG
jgi:hypothetical protein